jgi:uncharacterized membrane protein
LAGTRPGRRRFVLLAAPAVSVPVVDIASYAYGRLGLARGSVIAVLFLSVLGSCFNIPVARLAGATTLEPMLARVYGMLYVVPRPVRAGTKIVAVNVGGAVVPTILSSYLIVRDHLGPEAAIAVGGVAAVTHLVARVVPGFGIVVPNPGSAGTFGTLVGGDLLNLRRIPRLDAPCCRSAALARSTAPS